MKYKVGDVLLYNHITNRLEPELVVIHTVERTHDFADQWYSVKLLNSNVSWFTKEEQLEELTPLLKALYEV